MQLEFLGTSAGQPAKHRNVSSLALKLLNEINEVWLFDCGEGTQRQILETSIRPRKISKIFITHLHGDHIYGLFGLLASRSFQASDEQTAMTIYGPKGIKDFVMQGLKATKTFLAYQVHFKEFEEGFSGQVLESEHFSVYAESLDHTIFCLGYRVVQKDLEGQLDADKLKAAGLPFGPLFGKIKSGEDVTLEDGRTLYAKDFLSDPRPGKVITILGDTRKCHASIRLATDADVLVHEATYGKGDEALAKKHGHATCVEAAQVAYEAGCKKLLLNHISPRFLSRDIRRMRQGAQAVFENVYVVNDFDEIVID